MENTTAKLKNITKYSLHQLLFLTEELNQDKKKFGDGKNASEEPAFLGAHCKLSAPSSDCINIAKNKLTLNATSLVGINSVLPHHLTEKIINHSQLNQNNKLLDFFNIFHQRLFGLTHKIEKRSKISLCSNKEYNPYFINSISGTTLINEFDFLRPFAGLIWQKQRNSNTLKIVLESIFLAKIEIKQYIKQKIDVEKNDQIKLGNTLKNKILGNYAYCMHRKIKIILSFENLEFYDNTLPKTSNFKLLKKICNYYLSPHFSFNIELKLNKKAKTQLTTNSEKKLGLNSWLGNKHNNFGCYVN